MEGQRRWGGTRGGGGPRAGSPTAWEGWSRDGALRAQALHRRETSRNCGGREGPLSGGGVPTTSSTPGALPGKVEDSGSFGGRGEMEVNPGSAALSLEPPCDSASVSYSCQMR